MRSVVVRLGYMRQLLRHAPIDEVVVGFLFDRAVGPDAVEAGLYLGQRADFFGSHEIHEPVVDQAVEISWPLLSPLRTWLIGKDPRWLVQLQHDRFHANWRKRPEASYDDLTNGDYPGFTRESGIMTFALSEFERLRSFCREAKGAAPNLAKVEVSKIDLLYHGIHWKTIEDAVELLPALGFVRSSMRTPGHNVALQTQETVDEITISTSLSAARLKDRPETPLFRLEFRAVALASGDLTNQLKSINEVLNRAFERFVPDATRRFS